MSNAWQRIVRDNGDWNTRLFGRYPGSNTKARGRLLERPPLALDDDLEGGDTGHV